MAADFGGGRNILLTLNDSELIKRYRIDQSGVGIHVPN